MYDKVEFKGQSYQNRKEFIQSSKYNFTISAAVPSKVALVLNSQTILTNNGIAISSFYCKYFHFS